MSSSASDIDARSSAAATRSTVDMQTAAEKHGSGDDIHRSGVGVVRLHLAQERVAGFEDSGRQRRRTIRQLHTPRGLARGPSAPDMPAHWVDDVNALGGGLHEPIHFGASTGDAPTSVHPRCVCVRSLGDDATDVPCLR